MDEIIKNSPAPESTPESPIPTPEATPGCAVEESTCGGGCASCDDCSCDGNLCEQCRANKKQMVFDWMGDAPETVDECDYVEVQFKNTRKGYYLNSSHLELHKGDMVAVEGNPGHDIGEVTLTGYLVKLQMKKTNFRFDDPSATRKVFRLAKPNDMERYREAKAKEHDTMLRSRKIAEDLKLEMKIGDVEYQGDGNKAIFYYIADGRVDFRQLIKVLAEAFKVRIEMKQIGARQEAGRIGGIGPCGRELCCSGWMTKFMSVGTGAARFQDLSLNPQKLAGQCAKLKCCLNYEVDCYMEAGRELPAKDIVLQTQDTDYYYFKADMLARTVAYSTSKDGPFNLVTISVDRAREVIDLNKHGQKPESLAAEGDEERSNAPEFADGVGDESLTRFDSSRKKKKGGKGGNKPAAREERKGGKPAADAQPAAPKGEKGEKAERVEKGDNTPKPAPQKGKGDAPKQPKPQKPRDNTQRPRRPQRDNNRPKNDGKAPEQTPPAQPS
jgi:cell fate regulator YaaT (PSP1 superfamily)